MAQGLVRDYVVNATGDSDMWKRLVEQAVSAGTSTALSFAIPAGVDIFYFSIENLDATTSANIEIQLGTAGGLVTTGYFGSGATLFGSSVDADNSQTTIQIARQANTQEFNGSICFTRVIGNKWAWHGVGGDSNDNAMFVAGGLVDLTDELTTLELQTNGSETWIAGGLANLMYNNPNLGIERLDSVAAGVTDVFVNGVQQASTSGADIDFSIPSGVKQFTMMLESVTLTGSSNFLVRLGDAVKFHVLGYESVSGRYNTAAATTEATTGIDMWRTTSYEVSGVVRGILMDAATNKWIITHQLVDTFTAAAVVIEGTGFVSLDSELTDVRLRTASGDTFTGGSVNIQYENQELDLGSALISGGVVQTVNVQDGEVATTTTQIPGDDTVPQNTEGEEFMTASITPTNAANKLRIDVTFCMGTSLVALFTTAIFQDSNADALAGVFDRGDGSGAPHMVTFTHWMTAGTASSTTFKVRAGLDRAGTLTFNGTLGARELGGVMASTITITEYKA